MYLRSTTLRSIIDAVRTFENDPDIDGILRNIRILQARFEPDSHAKVRPSHRLKTLWEI